MVEENNIIKSAKEIALENADRIAKEVKPEDLDKLELSKEASRLANGCLAGDIELKELLDKIEKQKEKETIIKMMQAELIERVTIEKDNGKITKIILELEKKKKSSNYQKYATIESVLGNEMKMLQHQYNEMTKQGYEEFKLKIADNVRETTERMEQTMGAKVDFQKSLETTINNSQEWRDFLVRLNSEFDEAINNYKNALKELIWR